MYHENLKDPYHATLLHSFLVVFGLLVAGNESAMIADSKYGMPRHHGLGQEGRQVRRRSATTPRRRCAPSTKA